MLNPLDNPQRADALDTAFTARFPAGPFENDWHTEAVAHDGFEPVIGPPSVPDSGSPERARSQPIGSRVGGRAAWGVALWVLVIQG
ncbi:hypothetical protein APR08_005225 [Nocardia amikacinitolerans]|nr:hypothetical protein [Nocardia amikacinitolerans]